MVRRDQFAFLSAGPVGGALGSEGAVRLVEVEVGRR